MLQPNIPVVFPSQLLQMPFQPVMQECVRWARTGIHEPVESGETLASKVRVILVYCFHEFGVLKNIRMFLPYAICEHFCAGGITETFLAQ